MRDDDKPDILTRFRLCKLLARVEALRVPKRPEWLRLAQERTGLIAVPSILFLVVVATWALVALTLFLGFYAVLVQLIFQDPPEGQEALWNWRFSIAQLVAVTTVLGAVIALPITLNRLVLTRRQTEASENDHFNSVQGQITDRINTAVQGLGAQKEVNRIGRPVFLREIDPNHTAMDGPDSEERHTDIEWKDEPFQSPVGMYVAEEEQWQVFTQTQANLEVRIGAIYALERIAQDSDRDHVQIMEILCAYIRQNAPAPVTDDWPELEMKDSEDEGPLEADWEDRLKAFRQAQEEAKKNLKPREDIQAALTVIGRRSAKQRRLEAGRGVEAPFPFDVPCPEYDELDKGGEFGTRAAHPKKLKDWDIELEEYRSDPKRYQLDMRSTDLRGADMSTGNFKGARLNGSRLEKADLWEACFQGAVFRGARLQGADLEGTHLQGALLGGADLHGANLKRARMQCAKLWETRLIGVLLNQVQLRGVSLKNPEFDWAFKGPSRGQGSTLKYVGKDGLAAAQLHGAALRETDCTFAEKIQEHLKRMFRDATVTLPGGHGPGHKSWPKHWPKFDLGDDFEEEWSKWQAHPTDYRPPDPPEPQSTA